MARLTRPSLILRIGLDDVDHDDARVADLKRAYAFIAPVVVSANGRGAAPATSNADGGTGTGAVDGVGDVAGTGAASDAAPSSEGSASATVDGASETRPDASSHNTMTLQVVLHRPYWQAGDPEADEQWGVMPHWLDTVFYKVDNNIVAGNERAGTHGLPPIGYESIDVDFSGVFDVAFHVRPGDGLPGNARQTVEEARALCGDGSLGEGAVAVVVPAGGGVWTVRYADGSERPFDAAAHSFV